MPTNRSPQESKEKIAKYFAGLPVSQRATLKKIRQIIKKTVPGTQEDFSYGIPGIRVLGEPLVWYAAFKDHYSLFPTGSVVGLLKTELKGYLVSKGTIQLPVDKPLPVALIKKIVNTRLKQIKKA